MCVTVTCVYVFLIQKKIIARALINCRKMRQLAISCFASLERREALFFLCVAVSVYLLSRPKSPYLCLELDEAELAAANPRSLSSPAIIFIGGHPGSGTTLFRAMLDGHANIRCTRECQALHQMLALYRGTIGSEAGRRFFESTGVPYRVLARATRAFVTKIVAGRGTSGAKYLCYKGPLLQELHTLERLFAASKFVFMIRDGRAVARSVADRLSTVFNDSFHIAQAWNNLVNETVKQCSQLADKCMTVFYEELVRDPSGQMKEVLRFLDIPWHDDVLRHHELIGSEVSLSE